MKDQHNNSTEHLDGIYLGLTGVLIWWQGYPDTIFAVSCSVDGDNNRRYSASILSFPKHNTLILYNSMHNMQIWIYMKNIMVLCKG